MSQDKEVLLPYISQWPHKRVIVLAAACFALLVGAQTAAADSPCPYQPTSQVLAPFGDTANYTLVSGGTFEGDMTGWSLNGASVAPGNEPWFVNSTTDSQSLSIAPGGTAVSPPFCLSNQFPSWRFFAQGATSAPGAVLNVNVEWTDKYGNSGQTPVTSLGAGNFATWALSQPLVLGSLLDNGRTVSARLVFNASPASAWSVDDVYLDPYAR